MKGYFGGDHKEQVRKYAEETDVIPVLDDGHAFDPVILAMTEAHRNGIDNLIWK